MARNGKMTDKEYTVAVGKGKIKVVKLDNTDRGFATVKGTKKGGK